VAENSPLYPQVGRKVPSPGAHIFLGQPNIFFLTVNAKDRVAWMAQPAVQASLVRIWQAEATAWLVGYYLIMPDHLHLFCAPRDLHFGIDSWLSYWKSAFGRAHVQESWAFQRKGFHHRMRNQKEFSEKWTYVRENPVRKGLAKSPEEWPYQGMVHEVRW
jgi:REP element-mobilizing transposase RayT